MPEIKISVSPEYRDYITTVGSGNDRYLKIKITGAVEVNGILINANDEKTENTNTEE